MRKIFPFVVELEQDITVPAGTVSELRTFEVIQNYLRSKSVHDFYRSNKVVRFKKGFFTSRTHIFAVIDKGEFELVENESRYTLKYRVYFLQLFIMVSLMSIAFGLVSQNWVFSVIAFLFLGGLNFLISIVRQKGVLSHLVSVINQPG